MEPQKHVPPIMPKAIVFIYTSNTFGMIYSIDIPVGVHVIDGMDYGG